MPSQKHLNGLAPQHSRSRRSADFPTCSRIWRRFAVPPVSAPSRSILLVASPLPAALHSLQPAVFACEALHRTFFVHRAEARLHAAGHRPLLRLPTSSPADCPDDYRFACTSELVGSSGRALSSLHAHRHLLHRWPNNALQRTDYGGGSTLVAEVRPRRSLSLSLSPLGLTSQLPLSAMAIFYDNSDEIKRSGKEESEGGFPEIFTAAQSFLILVLSSMGG